MGWREARREGLSQLGDDRRIAGSQRTKAMDDRRGRADGYSDVKLESLGSSWNMQDEKKEASCIICCFQSRGWWWELLSWNTQEEQFLRKVDNQACGQDGSGQHSTHRRQLAATFSRLGLIES